MKSQATNWEDERTLFCQCFYQPSFCLCSANIALLPAIGCVGGTTKHWQSNYTSGITTLVVNIIWQSLYFHFRTLISNWVLNICCGGRMVHQAASEWYSNPTRMAKCNLWNQKQYFHLLSRSRKLRPPQMMQTKRLVLVLLFGFPGSNSINLYHYFDSL